ncbi:MAG: hypothetical protein LRY50_05485 [Geovibrio sp.]|uniref:hypothetical protein n=1 Tax=Geovibrio ferrireducens TaxID=46201 RepID=UPI0022452DF5|nr:hypothetical protein [Geovibrio ferrireducens]MCD8567806.1 hypothetical protein [Geovibrio sp.]
METKSSFAEGAEAFTSYDKSKRNPYHKSDMNAYDWNLGYSAAKKAYKEGIAAHYDGKKGDVNPYSYNHPCKYAWSRGYWSVAPKEQSSSEDDIKLPIIFVPFVVIWRILAFLWFLIDAFALLGNAIIVMILGLLVMALIIFVGGYFIYGLFTTVFFP